MYKVIKIHNFRGFDDATITGLTRINVITGLNGAGKTSVLEAAFLVCGGANAGLIASIYAFRGEFTFAQKVDRPFRSAFKDLDTENIPRISASSSLLMQNKKYFRELKIKPKLSIKKGLSTTEQSTFLTGVEFEFIGPSGKKTSNWGWNSNPSISGDDGKDKMVHQLGGGPVDNPDFVLAHFVSPYVRDIIVQNHATLTNLVTQRRINEVVDVLSIINPEIKDILPLVEGDDPVIYADIGGKALFPLSLLGTGLSNCLHIILPLITIKNGVILIDEFEDGLHHTLFKPMLKAAFRLARENNNQIFLSTHSNEFLSQLVDLAKEDGVDDVSFFRLAKRKLNGVIPRYSLTEAHSLLDSNLDMR